MAGTVRSSRPRPVSTTAIGQNAKSCGSPTRTTPRTSTSGCIPTSNRVGRDKRTRRDQSAPGSQRGSASAGTQSDPQSRAPSPGLDPESVHQPPGELGTLAFLLVFEIDEHVAPVRGFTPYDVGPAGNVVWRVALVSKPVIAEVAGRDGR